ncbi:MAG TPA: hypothetical protein DD730_09870 [Desulfosporosinus sp.]|jgi:hypothetical protein|nr:hypothetical protein [Desulfosporosinus sp.]
MSTEDLENAFNRFMVLYFRYGYTYENASLNAHEAVEELLSGIGTPEYHEDNGSYDENRDMDQQKQP